MNKSEEIKMKVAIMNMQREKLIIRYDKIKKREEFVRKYKKHILSLSLDGWPKTKNMKDYLKWFDIVCKAKIQGVYGIGTANCDVIMLISRLAKNINND
jgi:hypothetical protein